MNHLADEHTNRVYLKPGELFMSREPSLVSTVLGSCVSITVYSPTCRLGAICHALLPSGSLKEGFRFVDSTLDYMVSEIRRQGAHLPGCQVKLFGGADVLLPNDQRGNRLSVGQQNILAARGRLERHGITPMAVDVGGIHGRKLYFDSRTGHVYLKKMNKSRS